MSRVVFRQNLKAFLLRQRAQIFARAAQRPTVDRRGSQADRRSLTDRRSSTKPNSGAQSRRISVVDRRANRFGRRKSDLQGNA